MIRPWDEKHGLWTDWTPQKIRPWMLPSPDQIPRWSTKTRIMISRSTFWILGHVTHRNLSIIIIRKSNTDWLIDEKDICIRVPRVRIVFRQIRSCDRTWTSFIFSMKLREHEKHLDLVPRRVPRRKMLQVLESRFKSARIKSTNLVCHLTAISPEQDIVTIGVAPAFEEMEE